MIRRQDIAVLFFYYLGYSKIRNLLFCFKRKTITRFVMFHDVLPEELVYFRANLRFLKRSTNVLSLDDFFAGRLSSKKINIVITFDDGYKSWISDVIPILKELELPATFFISSGLVGLSKVDEAEFIRSRLLKTSCPRTITGALRVEDVKYISEHGFTVGGHGMNHSNMANIHDRDELRYEISEDKMRLEKIIGKRIEYFSYPFGAYDNPNMNLTEMLRELGYRGAVTTGSGFNDPECEPYLLHREITSASMPLQVFRARVYGNYDAVRLLKKLVRRFF